MIKKEKETKKTVCIVEDEPLIVEMYSKKLKNEGFNVITACDGQIGLEKIKKFKPDLVLIDLIMPNRNGFDLMKDLKKNALLSKIPIIVLTNVDGLEKRTLACELGALFFIVKSQCMPLELTKIVKEVLNVTLNNPKKN